ncbi:MAG: glycosyltransferase family 92 protein [Desulfovibrionaceae bacterium]
MFYTGICAIAKDEEHTIETWAKYHLSIGFEHITIFDNNSAFPIKKLLSDYIHLGLVNVIDIPEDTNQQLSSYYTFLKTFSEQSRWVAFIDIDEYIVPKAKDNIRDFLQDFEEFAGIAVNWVTFGSNGHLKRPATNILQAYTTSIYKSHTVKSIIQPSRVSHPLSPHHFKYIDGSYCVNEDKFPVPGPFSYHTSRSIQINHYYYQSQQDFCKKIERGFATPVSRRDGYSMEEFYKQATQESFTDHFILQHYKKLKLLNKKSFNVFAQIILEDCSISCSSYIKKIAEKITASDVDSAVRLYKNACRYYCNIHLDLVGIVLYGLLGEHEIVMSIFRNALLRYEQCPSERTIIYRELSKYYTSIGREEEASCIEEEAPQKA